MESRNPTTGESQPLVANNYLLRNNRSAHPIFPSVPSLKDAASLFTETTSYMTRCLPDFSEPASRGSDGLETSACSSGNVRGSLVRYDVTTSERLSAVSESSDIDTDAPLIHEGITRSTVEESSQNTSALLQPAPLGISMFQSLIDRVQRTVRGSADDIGWLKRSPEMPPVVHGTQRFMKILDEIRHGVHRLPNSMIYLLVPGLFSNHGPLYFVSTKTSFSKIGLTCHIAKIHSEASVEKNAKEIKDYIEELYWGSGKRVLLLGHSKGGVDTAAALSMYWSDLKDKVAGLALAQSPYGGSPIASDILREGQLGDYVNMRKLMELLICNVIKVVVFFIAADRGLIAEIISAVMTAAGIGAAQLTCGDMQALEDLTYEKRKKFVRKHHLPRELPLVSFNTEASISPAVLATLSRVAHAELPMLSPLSAGQATTLPVVMPLGAVMAACAQILEMRYGEKSDGLVTCSDAEVPGSVVVRPKRKLDHAWMVYSSLNDDLSEANAAQVCEALLTLLVEVGEKKKQEFPRRD